MVKEVIIFIFVLLFLIYLSIVDIKTQRASNKHILALFLIGVGYRLIIKDIIALVLGIAMMVIISYFLYYKETIGGADVKLLVALMPFLAFKGSANMLVTLWFFGMEFLIIGLIYAFVWKIVGTPNNSYIPFIPAITLTYIVSWIFQFH